MCVLLMGRLRCLRLGFRVSGLGLGFTGSGFGISGFRVQALGFGAYGVKGIPVAEKTLPFKEVYIYTHIYIYFLKR